MERVAAAPSSVRLARQRNVILAALLVAAAVAWVLVVQQSGAGTDMMAGGLGLTMGVEAPAYIGMWTLMMVAMMFPASAPMILMFSTLQSRKRAAGRPYVPASIFTASYLVVWTVLGVGAFVLSAGLDRVAANSPGLVANWPRIAGGLIIAAGVYQLTPLKEVCLGKCRTPFSFLLTHWRDGWTGAFRMGLTHGLYCAGCCWLLFLILVPLGVMNLAAMAAIAVLVFAEKTLPLGAWTASASAVGLVAYGAVVLASPGALPGMM